MGDVLESARCCSWRLLAATSGVIVGTTARQTLAACLKSQILCSKDIRKHILRLSSSLLIPTPAISWTPGQSSGGENNRAISTRVPPKRSFSHSGSRPLDFERSTRATKSVSTCETENKAAMMNISEIASILTGCIAANKGGVPIEKLNEEYNYIEGNDIPYLSLGFYSLYEFMSHLDSIKTERNAMGEVVYKIRNNPKVQHIVDLVDQQRTRQSKKNGRYERHSSRTPTPPLMSHRPTKRRRRARTSSKKNDSWAAGIPNSGGEDSYEIFDDCKNPVIVQNPPSDLQHMHSPVMGGQQMIGDDFFLQLAIRNLGEPIWRERDSMALRSGLCKSGQTIRACALNLVRLQSLSNRVVIMIGAEDIYRGNSFEKMAADYRDLLNVLHERFAFSKNAIKLCTLPPLGNIGLSCNPKKMKTLVHFNNWLRQFAMLQRYQLIDVHNNMTNANMEVEWDLFQLDARMVSGTQHPYVLFNKRGRKLLVSLITQKISQSPSIFNNSNWFF